MKYLDPTQATDAAQQPVKNGTLQFLQDAHKETVANLIQGLIGTAYEQNIVYALWGCNNNLQGYSNTEFWINEGGVFYEDEVFSLTPTLFQAAAGQTAVMVIVTTQYSPAAPLQADPLTFSDGVQRNVHNIRTVQVVSGPAGGAGVPNYIGDYSAIQFPPINLSAEVASRIAAISALQSQISSTTITTPLQTQINNLQSQIGSVPSGSNAQSQISTLQNQVAALNNGGPDPAPQLSNSAGSGQLLVNGITGSINVNAGSYFHYVYGPDKWIFASCTFSANFGSCKLFSIDLSSIVGATNSFRSAAGCLGNQVGNNFQIYISPGTLSNGSPGLFVNSLDGSADLQSNATFSFLFFGQLEF